MKRQMHSSNQLTNLRKNQNLTTLTYLKFFDHNVLHYLKVFYKELYVTRYWYVNWAMVVHINIQGPLN